MNAILSGVLARVGDLWRRDRAILWPLSGLLLFLPQYAVLLLIPAMPPSEPGGSIETWSLALQPWIAAYGGWYIAAAVCAQFGALAVVSLYAEPPLTVGGALLRAARLFLRAMLASLLVTMPCGAVALVSLGIPVAPIFVLPGIVYVLARTALVGPVIVGEPGTGAVAAIVRSWRLTSGQAWPIAVLVGAAMIGGQAIGALIVGIEHGVRAGAFANPPLLAMIDAAAAAVTWAAGLALALAQVALYRTLR